MLESKIDSSVNARVGCFGKGVCRVPNTISAAATENDCAAFGVLVREYVDWCRARFAQDSWLIDEALSHQALDYERETLQTRYGPPSGKAFLARRDGEVVGCGAYRRRSDEFCEMKRLFVPDRFRGLGIGRKLCDTPYSQHAPGRCRRRWANTSGAVTPYLHFIARPRCRSPERAQPPVPG
jgi:GNAT superfamily N-acetyltransferase